MIFQNKLEFIYMSIDFINSESLIFRIILNCESTMKYENGFLLCDKKLLTVNIYIIFS